MPRLAGHAVHERFNSFDAIFDGFEGPDGLASRLLANGVVRIFRHEHVGQWDLTNLQVSGMLMPDVTHYINNWYARTNMIITDELAAWAESTICTLVVGDWPLAQMPLADLFRRQCDRPLPFALQGDVAEQRYVALARTLTHVIDRDYDDMNLGDQEMYVRGVKAVLAEIEREPLIIVPPRQSICVQVDTNQAALSELVRSAPQVVPAPRVWVHLEGFKRRDVC